MIDGEQKERSEMSPAPSARRHLFFSIRFHERPISRLTLDTTTGFIIVIMVKLAGQYLGW